MNEKVKMVFEIFVAKSEFHGQLEKLEFNKPV